MNSRCSPIKRVCHKKTTSARSTAHAHTRNDLLCRHCKILEKYNTCTIIHVPVLMHIYTPLYFPVQGDPEKSLDASKRPTTEFVADAPTDLASLYAKKGGVDLSILSELTQSVSGDDGLPSRSKRTCVRVREQISKLQEILDDESDTKPSPGGAGSKVKGRGTGRVSTGGRTSDVGLQESSVATSAKKYKRPAYSQFTHKRRKRKKKSPEEGNKL